MLITQLSSPALRFGAMARTPVWDDDDDERSGLISGQPNPGGGHKRCICTALVSFVLGMMALRAVQIFAGECNLSPLSAELTHTRHALHLARMASPPAIRVANFKSIVNDSLDWIEQQAPHFECEDEDITATYWYRWRLFRLHMVRRPQRARGCGKPEGCWVLTEFLRKVWWGGAFGTIVCPASHHIMEGRWLRDEAILDEYARFWFTGEGYRKQYVSWLVYALWQRSLVLHATPATGVVAELFGRLDAHYHDWMRTHYHSAAGCMYTSCASAALQSLPIRAAPRVAPLRLRARPAHPNKPRLRRPRRRRGELSRPRRLPSDDQLGHVRRGGRALEHRARSRQREPGAVL